jgi:hypothetical protein
MPYLKNTNDENERSGSKTLDSARLVGLDSNGLDSTLFVSTLR